MKALDVKEFVKGVCFICKKKIDDEDAYVHYECAEAYTDEKYKRIKEADEKQTK